MGKGLYTEEVKKSKIPFHKIITEILGVKDCKLSVLRFCDDGEGDINRYNVYKVFVDGKPYVLKKSSSDEIFVYKNLLKNKNFAVPAYCGSSEHDGVKWILIEYIDGCDLREFDANMAFAAADSITRIMNAYWQNDEVDFINNKLDDRFEKYWERINKRAEKLKNEQYISDAYKVFLKRQLTCPRTLSNGDFLQFNGIYNGGKVFVIDWAFGGIMPYSLDIARLIAHGTEDKRYFPFYMDDGLRKIYVEETYKKLTIKPEKARYIEDIKLSLLNEYAEFVEINIDNPPKKRPPFFFYYYEKSQKLAKEILKTF